MSENKKTFAAEMYEQESKDIERAIETLNKLAEEREKYDDVEINGVAKEIDQKAIILDYLEKAYSGAKMMDDVELMCRLSRAIVAFSYDDMEKIPTWDEMLEAYMFK